jgi:uncharacterized protein involved in outer membrane biogenesis
MQQAVAQNRRGKSIFLRTLLAVTLVLIAAIVICEIIGWPFLRVPFERFASEQLHRQIRIAEPFQLRLVGGLRLKVGGLWVAAPEGFKAPHFVDTRQASLQLRYGDLYRLRKTDELRVKALEVSDIDLRLIRHADGKASWHFKQDNDRTKRRFPVVEKLIATKGYAEIVDVIHEADFKVDFTTNEGANQRNAVSHVHAKGHYKGQELQAGIDTNGFLPITTHDETAPPVRSRGWADYAGLRLDFDGTISDLLGRQRIDAKVKARGVSLSVLGNFTNSVLPVTDKFVLTSRVKKNDEVWNVDVINARIGSSDLFGRFRYDPRPERPSLDGELGGKRLVLEDLFPAFGTRKGDGTVVKPRKGKLFADRPLDLPSLNKMDANIIVRLDYIDPGNAFAEPIRPFKADLSMQKGKLALAKIDASTAGGSISGLISIDAYQDKQKTEHPPPKWAIDLHWKDIDLEKWLRISKERKQQARREGDEEVPPAYITGMLNGRTKLAGQGNSTKELMASLDGEILTYVRKGTISHLLVELIGIDLAQSLGIKLKGDDPLVMQCAVMDFHARNGIAKPQAALIDTNVTLVLVDGSLNLAEETLDLRLIAKPKNVSPFTLRSPIRVRGTFVDPNVKPEGGPIAARVAGSVALAFVNPLAALLPFVDLGAADDEPSPCKQTLSEFSKQSR